MKSSFLSITILLASSGAFAIDLESMQMHNNKQPVFHKDCSLMVGASEKDEHKASEDRLWEVLKQKGYQVKTHQEVVKPFNKPLGYGLFSKAKKERKQKEHEIERCEKLSGTLVLGFESGWKTPLVGFNKVKIEQYDVVDCPKIELGHKISHNNILREHTAEYQKPAPSELVGTQTVQEVVSAQHLDTLLASVVAMPPCQISSVTTDVNDLLPTGAPLPEQELSVDEQDRNTTKEMNLRELERIEQLVRFRAQSR